MHIMKYKNTLVYNMLQTISIHINVMNVILYMCPHVANLTRHFHLHTNCLSTHYQQIKCTLIFSKTKFSGFS